MARVQWQQTLNGQQMNYYIEQGTTPVYSSPLNTAWSTEGVYAGATRTDLLGGYVTAEFPTWQRGTSESSNSNVKNIAVNKKTMTGACNLRFMCVWDNYNQSGLVRVKNYARYTGLPEYFVQKVESASKEPSTSSSTANNVTYTNGLSKKDYNTFFTDGLPYQSTPFQHLNINNLILYPVIHIDTITLTKNQNKPGFFTGTPSHSVASYSWGQIKPQDKSDAGASYTELKNLFDNKYEVIEDSETRLVVRTCSGASLNAYYGDCSYRYDPDTDTYIQSAVQPIYGARSVLGSGIGSTEPLASNYNRASLAVVQEMYNSDLGGIVYQPVRGLRFTQAISAGNIQSDDYVSNMSLRVASNYKSIDQYNMGQYGTPYTPKNYGGVINNADEDTPPVIVALGAECSSYSMDFVEEFDGTDGMMLKDTTLIQRSGYNIQPVICSIACFSINEIWTILASLGCYIAADATTASQAPTGKNVNGNNRLYCGEMTADGMTTGKMIQGGDIITLPQTDSNDIVHDTPYTPVTPSGGGGGGGEPGDISSDDQNTGGATPFGKFDVRGVRGFTTQYVMTAVEIQSFGIDLWGGLQSNVDILRNFFFLPEDEKEILSNFELSYSSVIDYLVSCKVFPFNVTSYAYTATQTGVKIGTGRTAIGDNTTTYLTESMAKLDGGSLYVEPKFSSFLDHEPVTCGTLFIPFCGTTDITLSEVTGHTLNLTYYVDLISGCCTAIVDMDGLQPVAELHGVMGFDILMTGNNGNQQLSSVMSTLRHMSVNAVSGLGSIALGYGIGAGGMVESGLDTLSQMPQQIAHTAVDMPKTASLHPISAGATSSLDALSTYRKAWLQIKRHNPDNPSNYGATNGFMSIGQQTYTIGECSGYTEVYNPDLSNVNCTEQEKNMLYNILTTGFYA